MFCRSIFRSVCQFRAIEHFWILPLVLRLKSMEEASHPFCDWKRALSPQQHANPFICFNVAPASSALDLYRCWTFPSGSSQARSPHWRRASRDRWVNMAQRPPPGQAQAHDRLCWLLRDNQIMAKYWTRCRAHPESPVGNSRRWGWRQSYPSLGFQGPRGRRGWRQELPRRGQLGPSSACRTLAAPQREMDTAMNEVGGEGNQVLSGKAVSEN